VTDHARSTSDYGTNDAIEPVLTGTGAIRRWQIGLILFGMAFLGLGGIVLLNDVAFSKYPGIIAWFIGAILVHDGIAAMVVFGVSVLMRRTSRVIPLAVIAIVQGALVIAAIVTALVVPEILKQAIGSANPTILPLDYTLNLGLFYAGLAVATVAALLGYAVLARRQKDRPSISQH
jgi:hypothetical protein